MACAIKRTLLMPSYTAIITHHSDRLQSTVPLVVVIASPSFPRPLLRFGHVSSCNGAIFPTSFRGNTNASLGDVTKLLVTRHVFKYILDSVVVSGELAKSSVIHQSLYKLDPFA